MQQRSALVHSGKLLLADRDGLALLDKQPLFGLSRYDGGASGATMCNGSHLRIEQQLL